MPDYTPDEGFRRCLSEGAKESRLKELSTRLKANHLKYVRGLPSEELNIRIDSVVHVLDISHVSYERKDIEGLSETKKRNYLASLLASAELPSRLEANDSD